MSKFVKILSDVKTTVMSVHHIVDDKIIDEALFFEQRKHFPAKRSQVLRGISARSLPQHSANDFF
jgi:hypothetical protein